MKENSWIGVDLDGTLAVYERWGEPHDIGEPIMPMVERVRQWLEDGWEVRVVTARVDESSHPPDEIKVVTEAIANWTEKYCGKRLVATSRKDFAMAYLYDDRAVQVEPNTGRILGVEPILKRPAA